MTGKLIATLGSMMLVLPAVAQDQPYPYPDDQGGAWNQQGDAAEGAYGAYPDAAAPDVEVQAGAPGVSVSFETFHDGLAPYGQWVTVPAYGRVWRPMHVAAGWRPYFYGKWEWTDDGWLWVSDEPWGWAAYHYGRWAYEPAFGWVWVPGYRWAPAWVTWRYSPDYVGWAPLGPGFSVYASTYPAVYGWWTFVPCRRFAGVPVHSVAFTGAYVRGIYHATMAAPPRSFVHGERAAGWGGPARPFVEHRIGHAIMPVRVQPVPTPAAIHGPASAGVVPVYRPGARIPAPGHVMPVPGFTPRAGIAPAPGPGPRGTASAAPATPPRSTMAPTAPRQWGGPDRMTGRTAAPAPAPAPAPGRAPSAQPSSGNWPRPTPSTSGRPLAASPQPQHLAPAPVQQQVGRGAAQRPQGGGAVAPHAVQGVAPAPRPQGGGGGQVQHGGGSPGVGAAPHLR